MDTVAYDRLYRHFPQIRENSNPSQVFLTEKRSGAAIVERRNNESVIYSLITKDLKALRKVMRLIIREVDARNEKLLIDLVRYNLLESDINLLFNDFNFEKCPFRRKVLVRRPQQLADVAFEMLPALEYDDKVSIVNNEDEGNCYLVRNVYEENIAIFYSKSEAEVFLKISR